MGSEKKDAERMSKQRGGMRQAEERERREERRERPKAHLAAWFVSIISLYWNKESQTQPGSDCPPLNPPPTRPIPQS